MKQYDQIFTLEVNKTKEEIIHLLETSGKVIVRGNNITVSHNPPWYMIFAGRGIITMKLDDINPASKSIMQCVLSPSLADARTIFLFLMWNLFLWVTLLYFWPWNVSLLIVFFIEWLMMAFIAIPVLILTVVIVSIYILSISFSGPTIFFVAITWSFLLLLINASIRYNRGELKKWVIRLFL